jgi:hypothetical protein
MVNKSFVRCVFRSCGESDQKEQPPNNKEAKKQKSKNSLLHWLEAP